jgi:hypothetical protein
MGNREGTGEATGISCDQIRKLRLGQKLGTGIKIRNLSATSVNINSIYPKVTSAGSRLGAAGGGALRALRAAG